MKFITFTSEQLLTEEWRDIKDFEGYYQVSNIGRVGKVIKNGSLEIMQSALVIHNRYSFVTLHSPTNHRQTSVHKLVAETFIPNDDESKSQVNHIDGDTSNNSIYNLEWVTPKENIQHAMATGLRQTSWKKKVKCLDTGEILSCIADAARMCDTDTTRIVESINTQSCCKGFTFIYPDTVEDEEEYLRLARAKYRPKHMKPNMPNSCPVMFLETSQEFKSLKEASRAIGCDPMTIKSHCKSGKPYKGITMKFKTE